MGSISTTWDGQYRGNFNGPIHVGQPHLIEKILHENGMTDANESSPPLPNNLAFDDSADGTELKTDESENYR